MTYDTRTPEAIQEDYKNYTQEDVNQVYESLTKLFKRSAILNSRHKWLDSIYNGNQPPHKKIRDMIATGLDWFYYGN